VNYDNSLAVTITMTCYSWAPSSGDHLFPCGPSPSRHSKVCLFVYEGKL